MKTLRDLLGLVSKEIELNEGKDIKYQFMVDTEYNWVSMKESCKIENIKKEDLSVYLENASIATPEQLQEVYYIIFNNGRSKEHTPKLEGTINYVLNLHPFWKENEGDDPERKQAMQSMYNKLMDAQESYLMYPRQ